MSKAKDAVEEFRKAFFDKKKEEMVETATKQVNESLDGPEFEAFDIIQNPDKKGRDFISVTFKYKIVNNKIVVLDTKMLPFADKTAGLSIMMDKENRKYLIERNNRSNKK